MAPEAVLRDMGLYYTRRHIMEFRYTGDPQNGTELRALPAPYPLSIDTLPGHVHLSCAVPAQLHMTQGSHHSDSLDNSDLASASWITCHDPAGHDSP